MDFGEALREMRKGRAVTRSSWDGTGSNSGPQGYQRVWLDQTPGRIPDPMVLLSDGTTGFFTLNGLQLMADDWELA